MHCFHSYFYVNSRSSTFIYFSDLDIHKISTVEHSCVAIHLHVLNFRKTLIKLLKLIFQLMLLEHDPRESMLALDIEVAWS